ncbi:MAG TPA: chlorite dismutase family protein [Spirochaetia bacterium]|nr:chlorite dismutase family protein [Spirochaetia bacterium]
MNDDAIASAVDVREKGRTTVNGIHAIDRRLFVQFLAFGACRRIEKVEAELRSSGLQAVLYEDLNDPFGIGLITYSEEPDYFLDEVRDYIVRSSLRTLAFKQEYTMFGRTYARGYESDLQEAIIDRPKRNLQDETLPWAVWYPLRRTGAFEELSPEDQRAILGEHGKIGHAFGTAGVGHDVRLACHGLNKDDNDFVIGVLGPQLHPLSIIVQTMRKTRQTAHYIARLGPFFTGRVVWRAASASTQTVNRTSVVAAPAASEASERADVP